MALGSFGRPPLEWWEREDAHDEIADLIAWLADTCELRGVDEAIHICRKPWKYESERRQMLKARAAA